MGPFALGQKRIGFPSVVLTAIAFGHPQEQPAFVGVAKAEVATIDCARVILGDEHRLFADVIGAHPHGDGALRDAHRGVVLEKRKAVFTVEVHCAIGRTVRALGRGVGVQKRLVFVKRIGFDGSAAFAQVVIGAVFAVGEAPISKSTGQPGGFGGIGLREGVGVVVAVDFRTVDFFEAKLVEGCAGLDQRICFACTRGTSIVSVSKLALSKAPIGLPVTAPVFSVPMPLFVALVAPSDGVRVS